LHWRYTCPLTLKIFDKLNAESNVESKESFITRLELRMSLETVDEWTVCEAKQIIHNLQHNRSFQFLIPNVIDVVNLNNKITTLLQSIKHHRTLTYKFYQSSFDLSGAFGQVSSIQNFFQPDSKLSNHFSCILMKPNFQHLKFYELWEKLITPYAKIVDFLVIPKISEEQFTGLYSGCSTRPYGPAWREYLESDVVVALCMNSKNVAVLRNKCVQLRDQSQVTWIKNIVHCSANVIECYRDLNIFFKNVWEISKPSFLNEDFFDVFRNGEKPDLQTLDLEKRAIEFKKPQSTIKRKSEEESSNRNKKKVAIKFKVPDVVCIDDAVLDNQMSENNTFDYHNQEEELINENLKELDNVIL
jgi:hypothetical protein